MPEEQKNSITLLVMGIERIAEAQSKTNDKVDNLIISSSKVEVILEKLTNVEKQNASFNKVIHHRIDEAIKARVADCLVMSKKIEKIEEDCVHTEAEIIEKTKLESRLSHIEVIAERLEPLSFLVKYPKVAVLTVAGLYIFAFKDIRDIILKSLGWMS